jgi:hypothetical protein
MGIVNRRNAVLGWTVWSIGKRVAKRKAKQAVPSIDAETHRPNKSLVALLIAGAVGTAELVRRRSSDENGD